MSPSWRDEDENARGSHMCAHTHDLLAGSTQCVITSINIDILFHCRVLNVTIVDGCVGVRKELIIYIYALCVAMPQSL